MSTAGRTMRDDSRLGLRLLMALFVAGVTYFSWAVLWVIGASGLALASLFSGRRPPTQAERFGAVWQWVVAAFAIVLICTLLGARRYSRLTGTLWFLSIVVLAVNGILLPVKFDPALGPLVPVVIAAGLLVWIHLTSERAA